MTAKSVEGPDHGGRHAHRVDRRHLEPDHRLRPDLGRMRPLLRAYAGEAAEGDGAAEVSKRRWLADLRAGLRPDHPSQCTGLAVHLGWAPRGVRELDEWPVSRSGAAGFCRQGLHGDRRYAAAHLSGTDEALVPAAQAGGQAGVAAEPVDGRVGRRRQCSVPRGRSAHGARGRAILVVWAVAWATRRPGSYGDRLGYRRGWVRPSSPRGQPMLGGWHPWQVHRGGGAVLLQDSLH